MRSTIGWKSPAPTNRLTTRIRQEDVAGLVAAASQGDVRAWDQLIEQFTGFVLGVARAHRLNDHDAADVAQTTWLRVVEHLDRIHDPSRFGGWVATTARRECLHVLRTAARQIPAEEETFDRQPDEIPIDARLLMAERASALARAFSRLPARDQTLVRLLVAEPAPSYEEIGAALGMPVGSIGPTRGRCLERLRRELSSVGDTACAAA